jgi:hypothetical protein
VPLDWATTQSPFAKARGGWFDGLILAYWAAF